MRIIDILTLAIVLQIQLSAVAPYNLILNQHHSMASYQARQRISSLNNHHQSLNNPYPARQTRVFSQLDNITPPETKSFFCDNTNKEEKIDRIAQIKKKYQNLLNAQVSGVQNDVRASRGSQLIDQKRNKITTEKPFVAANERTYGTPLERPSLSANKVYQATDYSISKKSELKSQLNQSRSALSAMKSELQAKLNELNARTNVGSSVKKPSEDYYKRQSQDYRPREREEKSYTYSGQNNNKSTHLSVDESSIYEQISKKYSKYSKYIDSDDYKKPKVSTTTTTKEKNYKNQKNDDSSYLQKYMRKEGDRHKQQLSIISEKSNSNIEESFKENNQTEEEKPSVVNVDTSHVREITDPRKDQLFRRAQESQKIRDLQGEKKDLMKSVNSYFEDKSSKYNADSSFTKYRPQQYKVEQTYQPLKRSYKADEYSLSREFVEKRYQEKKDSITKQCTEARSIIEKEIKKDEFRNYSGNNYENDIKEATFGKQMDRSYTKAQDERPNTSPVYQPVDYENYKRERSISAQLSKNEEEGKQQFRKSNWKVEYKDNEELSDKISKIDMKIKEIQSKKKNVEIDYKPYQAKGPIKHSNPEDKKDSRYDQLSREAKQMREPTKEMREPVRESEFVQAAQTRTKIASYLEKVRPLYSEKTIPEAARSKGSDFSIKLIPAWKQEI